MAISAVFIPVKIVIVAAVSTIQVAFRYVVAVVTISIIHQICIEAIFAVSSVPATRLNIVFIIANTIINQFGFWAWLQALTFLAEVIPARLFIVAAVAPIPLTFPYVVGIVAERVIE